MEFTCVGVSVDLPAVVVDFVVAVVACQNQVVQVGCSAVAPPDDVMGSAPQRVGFTADAVLIPGDQSDPLSLAGIRRTPSVAKRSRTGSLPR